LTANPPRIKLDISFTGTNFRGFQLQSKGATVQGEVENAIEKIGFSPRLTGCSRTDGGVHARVFSAHFADTNPKRSCREILKGINGGLPDDILITSVSRIDGDFHARYSSIEKSYRYFLYLGDAAPPPVSPFITEVFPQISMEKMAEALPLFLHERDFRAFTTSEGRKSKTIREIKSLSILACEPVICLEITGRSFLHRMVRFIAGALVAYSRDKISKDFLESALSGKEDFLPFPALAAKGLHLWDVKYGEIKVREHHENLCPLKLWPFESVKFKEAGRAPS
jgi:tRNA pseudouridine38-40 synthase